MAHNNVVDQITYCQQKFTSIYQIPEKVLKCFIITYNSAFLPLPSSFSLHNLLPLLGGLEPFKRASVLSVKLSGVGGLSSGGERSKKLPV
jgi:hypothetical protein